MWHEGERMPMTEFRDESEGAYRYFSRREAQLNNF